MGVLCLFWPCASCFALVVRSGFVRFEFRQVFEALDPCFVGGGEGPFWDLEKGTRVAVDLGCAEVCLLGA
jgi:hypothetical protein